MPVTFDIMDNSVLGPAIRKGIEEGRSEGRSEGRNEGRSEGHSERQQQLLRLLLEKRFGTLPGWVEEKLAGYSISEADDLALRLLDARSLDELFSEKHAPTD